MDAPFCFKSEVWQHFGFPKSENEKGEKMTGKNCVQVLQKKKEKDELHTQHDNMMFARKTAPQSEN